MDESGEEGSMMMTVAVGAKAMIALVIGALLVECDG